MWGGIVGELETLYKKLFSYICDRKKAKEICFQVSLVYKGIFLWEEVVRFVECIIFKQSCFNLLSFKSTTMYTNKVDLVTDLNLGTEKW